MDLCFFFCCFELYLYRVLLQIGFLVSLVSFCFNYSNFKGMLKGEWSSGLGMGASLIGKFWIFRLPGKFCNKKILFLSNISTHNGRVMMVERCFFFSFVLKLDKKNFFLKDVSFFVCVGARNEEFVPKNYISWFCRIMIMCEEHVGF